MSDTNLLSDLGTLENASAGLMAKTTPVYQRGNIATSTGSALFGVLTNTGIELRDSQPSRSQRAHGIAKGRPHCRFLLTHSFATDSGDHMIVVGANPSGARSFQGNTDQELEYPQSDSTARRVFDWAVEGSMSRATTRIKRLTVINLAPVIHTDAKLAKQIRKTLDDELLYRVNNHIIRGLRTFTSGETHILFAYGKLEDSQLESLARGVNNAFNSESLWQPDFNKNLDYVPHPLQRTKGAHFVGIKPYKNIALLRK